METSELKEAVVIPGGGISWRTFESQRRQLHYCKLGKGEWFEQLTFLAPPIAASMASKPLAACCCAADFEASDADTERSICGSFRF